ncbi:MAG: hypothetical protein AAF483_08005 [Planctomycetota bacterium]
MKRGLWLARVNVVGAVRSLGRPWMAVLLLSGIAWGEVSICAAQEGQQELGSTFTLDRFGKFNAPESGARSEQESGVDEDGNPYLKVVLRPESHPSLKYRFQRNEAELKPGAAQVHFGRALLMWQMLPEDVRSDVSMSWGGDREPTLQERKEMVESLASVYAEIRAMALCEDQKSDLRLRDIGGLEMFEVLLPEYQSARELARALGHKYRVQLAEGDVDGAVDTLRDGFQLSAFVGQGETLVQVLVGIAIHNIMLEEALLLSELSEAPSLYWPIATLPRPFVTGHRAIELELGTIHRSLPVLKEAKMEMRDELYWSKAWAKLTEDLIKVGMYSGETSTKVGVALLSVATAEDSKARLIASGMDEDEVKAMPLMRAVLLEASQEIQRINDDLNKGFLLKGKAGLEVSRVQMGAFDDWANGERKNSAGALIAGLMVPAVEAVHQAILRQEFFVNRAMTMEAICLHVQANGGELPDSLESLPPAPALKNPFTDEHFEMSSKASEDG